MIICAIHEVDVMTATRENNNKLLDTPVAVEVKENEFIYFLGPRFMIQPRVTPVTCNISASPADVRTVKAPPVNVGSLG